MCVPMSLKSSELDRKKPSTANVQSQRTTHMPKWFNLTAFRISTYIPAITLTLIFVLRTELNQNIHFILLQSIRNGLSKFHSSAQTQARVHVRCNTHTHMKLRPICMHDTGHMCDFSLSMKRVSFVTRARACVRVYERVCLYTTAYYVM